MKFNYQHTRPWIATVVQAFAIATTALAVVGNCGATLVAGERTEKSRLERPDDGKGAPLIERTILPFAIKVFQAVAISAHGAVLCVPPLIAIWCWFVVPCRRWWRTVGPF